MHYNATSHPAEGFTAHHTIKQMHNRDITILVVQLWFSNVHYSGSSTFILIYSTIVPTLVDFFNMLRSLLQTIVLTD